MTTTYIVIKVTHKYPVEGLATKAANRAYTLQGVDDAEVIGSMPTILGAARYE